MAWQTPKTNWGQPGQTVPGVADFNRIEENIRILGEYNRAPGYGTATGTNAKTITLDPAPTSYYDGLCFAFKNATQNTGPVTINVNGLGARPIKKPNGKNLAAGNLKAGSIYTVRYNGTNFILQGEGPTGNATASDLLSGKTASTDAGEITGTMPNRGAVSNTITTQGGSYTIPSGYHNGSGIITASFSNLSADNVKKGVNIGGVVGTYDNYGFKEKTIDDIICSFSAPGYSAKSINLESSGSITINEGDIIPSILFFILYEGSSSSTITYEALDAPIFRFNAAGYKATLVPGTTYTMSAASNPGLRLIFLSLCGGKLKILSKTGSATATYIKYFD